MVGPYEFPQEKVRTNGPQSSLKASVLTGGKKRGVENLTNDTPPKKEFWTPPRTVRLPPLSGVTALFFPVQKSTTDQTRSSFGGVQKFSGERVLWYVFLPPYPLTQNYYLRKNILKQLFSEKLRISRVIPWKCLYFLDISRTKNRSKITKNNSQGIIFVIISCQRVHFAPPHITAQTWIDAFRSLAVAPLSAPLLFSCHCWVRPDCHGTSSSQSERFSCNAFMRSWLLQKIFLSGLVWGSLLWGEMWSSESWRKGAGEDLFLVVKWDGSFFSLLSPTLWRPPPPPLISVKVR